MASHLGFVHVLALVVAVELRLAEVAVVLVGGAVDRSRRRRLVLLQASRLEYPQHRPVPDVPGTCTAAPVSA